jgi:hypothetical protein
MSVIRMIMLVGAIILLGLGHAYAAPPCETDSRTCIVNGQLGEKFCIHGQWGQCIVQNLGQQDDPGCEFGGVLNIGDANDVATVLADSDSFWRRYFGGVSDDKQVELTNLRFRGDVAASVPYWCIGDETSALVQMYDLVAPLDAKMGGLYLERLRKIAGALLANRDDVHVPRFPADQFRDRVMPAWGGYADDRDGK